MSSGSIKKILRINMGTNTIDTSFFLPTDMQATGHTFNSFDVVGNNLYTLTTESLIRYIRKLPLSTLPLVVSNEVLPTSTSVALQSISGLIYHYNNLFLDQNFISLSNPCPIIPLFIYPFGSTNSVITNVSSSIAPLLVDANCSTTQTLPILHHHKVSDEVICGNVSSSTSVASKILCLDSNYQTYDVMQPLTKPTDWSLHEKMMLFDKSPTIDYPSYRIHNLP